MSENVLCKVPFLLEFEDIDSVLSFDVDIFVFLFLNVSLCMFQIGVAFYEMLQAVDQYCQHLSYMDPICDFLYHIKYMYTGDSVKEQVRFLL